MRVDPRILTGLAAAAITFFSLMALTGPRSWGDQNAQVRDGYFRCDRHAENGPQHSDTSGQSENFQRNSLSFN